MTEAQVAANATYQSAERVLALLKSFDDTRMELGVAEKFRMLPTLVALGRLCASD